MKKILLAIVLVFFAVSCGQKPETVVSKFIDNIKEKKIESAAKYTNYSSSKEFKENLTLEYNNKVQQLLFETLFKNMNYEILGTEKQDKNTTVVTVSVENIDTQKVFLNIFAKMLQGTLSKNENSNFSIEEEFNTILKSKDVPKSKNTTQFVVVKTKKGNKIDLTADNIDVLFGKLNSTLSGLDTLGDENGNSGGHSNDKATSGAVKNDDKEGKIVLPQEGPGAGKDQKLTEPKKK